jgi:hypothetical protein
MLTFIVNSRDKYGQVSTTKLFNVLNKLLYIMAYNLHLDNVKYDR